jgi:pyruvate formate lyase activating enzyme
LFCNRDVLDAILPHVDLIISDLKHMDTIAHKEFTGVPNERILDNLKYLAAKNVNIVLRIPVVPGHNDNDENMRASIDFILKEMNNNIRQLQFLPYRPLGTDKYEALGLEYPMKDMPPLNREEYVARLRDLADKFKSHGIKATAGTTTPIE